MREHAATVRLRDLLKGMGAVLDAASRDALRSAVHDFVDVAKGMGAPVERVIIALKEIAAEAGIRSSTEVVKIRARLETRDQLILDMVRWAVERYFSYERPPSDGAGKKTRRPSGGGSGQEMARRHPYSHLSAGA